ncbi:hypothetical protein COLO4_17377 [Corchorus olitorius]|uniref:RNase H type-1 domain-containing protein n=1 Tax=Corchorus olitorius TaxID=93759 RepID=A0A1R3JD43_9ROSI|nr:hypothetical protein COLO4_17377 [Corchorus olitorius]
MIWKARCETVIDGKDISVETIVYRIQYTVNDYLMYRKKDVKKISRDEDSRFLENKEKWLAPEEGWLKVNVDGAFDPGTSEGAVGIVARDHNGCLIGGTGMRVKVANAQAVEALAALKGCELARDKGWPRVIVEMDSAETYSDITRKSDRFNWKQATVYEEIKRIKCQLTQCKFSWVKRKANEAANWVAKQLNKGMELGNYTEHPSSFFVFILNKNGLPCPP